MPNSANATAGFLVFVPREEVIELTMSVEDALKMVVSLGVVVPGMAAGASAPRRLRALRVPRNIPRLFGGARLSCAVITAAT